MNDETIRNNVIEILKKYPETRNDDNLLILRFLIHLGFAYRRGDRLIIDLLKFDLIPKFESIRRIRQVIQNNENLYTPDKETINKRDKAESSYKTKYEKTTSKITLPNSHLMPDIPNSPIRNDYW